MVCYFEVTPPACCMTDVTVTHKQGSAMHIVYFPYRTHLALTRFRLGVRQRRSLIFLNSNLVSMRAAMLPRYRFNIPS